MRFTIQETASGDRNIERKKVVHKGESQKSQIAINKQTTSTKAKAKAPNTVSKAVHHQLGANIKHLGANFAQ